MSDEPRKCVRCGLQETDWPHGGTSLAVSVDASTMLCTQYLRSHISGCLPAFRGWVVWPPGVTDPAVVNVKLDQFLAERPHGSWRRET